MLGFEQNTDGSLVKEVSEATFMQDVVEASKERPVICLLYTSPSPRD